MMPFGIENWIYDAECHSAEYNWENYKGQNAMHQHKVRRDTKAAFKLSLSLFIIKADCVDRQNRTLLNVIFSKWWVSLCVLYQMNRIQFTIHPVLWTYSPVGHLAYKRGILFFFFSFDGSSSFQEPTEVHLGLLSHGTGGKKKKKALMGNIWNCKLQLQVDEAGWG